MFSWIIEHQAKILEIDAWKITIENTFTDTLEIGQSIAHDWACMTITEFNDDNYSFFSMEESFSKTNFWTKNPWDFFNVERSLKFWWKIDGHFVTGHIDCIWTVENIDKLSDWSWIIRVTFPEKFKKNIIQKWSITINWISLTVVDTWDDFLTVSVIPLTQEITNIWWFIKWETVNLEFDMMWKYIVNYMDKIS